MFHRLGDPPGLPSDALVNGWVHLLSRSLPAGWWSALAAAAVLIAIPYWALEKQFGGREIVARAGKSTLGRLW
jgi:hypothetical protein